MQAIQRNDKEQMRVQKKEYKGVSYIDIRVFFKPDNADEYIPTKKGITFNAELLPKVLMALSQEG